MGSSLGYNHTEQTKAPSGRSPTGGSSPGALIGQAHKGKTVSAKTKQKISEALSGDNHHRAMLGKNHSAETKAKISLALSGDNHPQFGKCPSAETRAKMSASLGTAILVYSEDLTLANRFSSAREAAKFFNCSDGTIGRYAKSGKLFKKEWVLSTSAK